MIVDAIHEFVGNMTPSTVFPEPAQKFVVDMTPSTMLLGAVHGFSVDHSSTVITAIGLIVLGFLAFKFVSPGSVLPGVPELKGVPILGAMPIYLKHGMPQLLGRLIDIGGDGISYANVVNNVLVSVHDPAMVREVLAYPEEIASRYRLYPCVRAWLTAPCSGKATPAA